MNPQEKKDLLEGLTANRDNLQKIIHDVSREKADLMLKNRDVQRGFLQKIGDLSFTFGAAIAPIIILSHNKNGINNFGLVLAGVGVYILNGFLALWKNKSLIEQDSNDIPHVGLVEEIKVRPLTNAINKLLFDVDNKTYQQEYRESSINALTIDEEIPRSKRKPSFWLDFVIINFVIASFLVVGAVWPFKIYLYWIFFAVAILIMLTLASLSYVRYRETQIKLKCKQDELDKIKKDYQDWHNREVLKK